MAALPALLREEAQKPNHSVHAAMNSRHYYQQTNDQKTNSQLTKSIRSASRRYQALCGCLPFYQEEVIKAQPRQHPRSAMNSRQDISLPTAIPAVFFLFLLALRARQVQGLQHLVPRRLQG